MIEELLSNNFEKLERLFPHKFVEKSIEQTYKINPFTKFYIIKQQNEIIGFINFDIIYDRAELININILEEYKGKGYGNKLLSFMIDELKNKVTNITLEVRIDNDIAIHLYKKYGFEIKAIRKNYYNGIDGLLMEREMM